MTSEEQYYRALFYNSNNIAKILESREISPCFLALAYAVSGRREDAEKILETVEVDRFAGGINQMAYAEAKMALEYRRRNFPNAKKQAETILVEYPNAAFATYTLARIALWERKPLIALGYYEKLLSNYPDHDGILLEVAKTLYLLRRYSESIEYTKQAKRSLRQQLYRLLFPLGTLKGSVILWFGASAFAVLTEFNVTTYVGLEILLTTCAFLFIRVDAVLFAILLYINLVITIAWFLCRWIW